MKVDINHSVKLINKIEVKKNIICESGISNDKDFNVLIKNNFRTFLIGEYLMRSKNPALLLKNMLNKAL